MKPGTIDLPFKSMRCVFGPASLFTSALDPTATMRLPRTATAWAIWKVSLTVMIFPLNRMMSTGACCACSDHDTPTTPLNSSSHANFFIASLQASRDPFFRCGDYTRKHLRAGALRFMMWPFNMEALVIRTRFFAISVAISMTALVTAVTGHTSAQAADTSARLTGLVSSEAEGPMEGVLVSARRAGSTLTITVVSDARGRYAFPANRLEPGAYTLRIRATGYDLDGPASVDVAAGRAAQLDLNLRKTQDLAAQLTNGEWFMSWPGTTEMKNGRLNCTQCHTLERVARSTHNADEWVKVLERMGRYAQGSTPERPQLRPNEHGGGRGNPIVQQRMGGREGEDPVMKDRVKATATYLATINLSSGPTWSYPLKTYPRPTGKATRVVVTEYDLPRKETLPHDAAVDSHGLVWYGDFGTHMLGMLDPKTGKVTEYPLPITKPGAPLGSLDIVLDKQENIWMGTMYQGSLAKFD